jgi:hypothetical protein
MPVVLSETLKKTRGLTMSSRGMTSLFSSKFYTTLIITIIVLILITIIYPCRSGTPIWIVGKLGFYIFITTLAILFMHDGVLYDTYQKKSVIGTDDEFIESLGGESNVAFGGDNLPVNPKFISDNYTNSVNNCEDNDTNSGNSDEIFAMFGV